MGIDIRTNERALRIIADTIRKNNEAQLSLIENYSIMIATQESEWDDSTFNAMFDAVKKEYARIKQLIEQTQDFPPYLEKLAMLIEENKGMGRGGI